MTDRKNILKKISSYLTKKSHINYLTIELISYSNKNIYIRFDYVEKIKAYKIVWYDLQFVDPKHLDLYTNSQLVASFFANRLVELLLKIDLDSSKAIDERILGDRVIFTNRIKPKEPKEYIYDRFLPLKWSALIDPLALTFSYLPRAMNAYLAEMFAIFDNNVEMYNSAKPIQFNLDNDNIDELFHKKIIARGIKLEDNVRFLEKLGNRYLAIVEDSSFYCVVIEKVVDDFHNMWCSSNKPYLDEHIYATLQCIRSKKMKSFYKVKRKSYDKNLLEDVRRAKFYLAFGVEGNSILLVSENGAIKRSLLKENDRLMYEVIEDDDNLSLSKLFDEMK